MLPTLHHGVTLNNQSRLEYQSNNLNSNQLSMLDGSDTRINKSRLLEFGGGNGAGTNGAATSSNYTNEHLHSQVQQQQYSKTQNKYGSDYSHLPHIRQND